MRFTKSDVAHIAGFRKGSFKSWQEIVQEVLANRAAIK